MSDDFKEKKSARRGKSGKKAARDFTSKFNWGEVDDEIQPEAIVPSKKKKKRSSNRVVKESHLPSTLSAVHNDYFSDNYNSRNMTSNYSGRTSSSDLQEDDLSLPSYGRPIQDTEEDEFIRALMAKAEEPEEEERSSSTKKSRKNTRSRKKSQTKTSSSAIVKSSEEVGTKSGSSIDDRGAPSPEFDSQESESRKSDSSSIEKRPSRKKSVIKSESVKKTSFVEEDKKEDKITENQSCKESKKNSNSPKRDNQNRENQNKQEKTSEVAKKDLSNRPVSDSTDPFKMQNLRSRLRRFLRSRGDSFDKIDVLFRTKTLSTTEILWRFLEAVLDDPGKSNPDGEGKFELTEVDRSDKLPKVIDTVETEPVLLEQALKEPAPLVSDLKTSSVLDEQEDSEPLESRVKTKGKGAEKRSRSKKSDSESEKRTNKGAKTEGFKTEESERASRSERPTSQEIREKTKDPRSKSVETEELVKSGDSVESVEKKSGFDELSLSSIMRVALDEAGYQEPTPVQKGTIARVMAGVDLIGQAKTGTGKTAAFLIPIIEQVETCDPGNNPVALIIVPTRELAVQVRDEALKLLKGHDYNIVAVYGGKPIAGQIQKLREGVDIVIGTPGRIIDLAGRRALILCDLRWVVLDEADRMLDIGFRPDIEKILKQTPRSRQTMLFSATLPEPVIHLARRYMTEPEQYDFSSKEISSETIEQFYISVDKERKFDALTRLLEQEQPTQAIVFCRTKRAVDRIGHHLLRFLPDAGMIHGDMTQEARDDVMRKFRSGKVRILVATDVIGRGIDVTGISHIINYDIPQFCDDYVHRVGRTGRMGREGVAFTLVTSEEGIELTRIEKRINRQLKRVEIPDFEAYTRPDADNVSEKKQEIHKPVYGMSRRIIRRAL